MNLRYNINGWMEKNTKQSKTTVFDALSIWLYIEPNSKQKFYHKPYQKHIDKNYPF